MIKSQVQEKQTTINWKLQSGNEIKALEEDKRMLETNFKLIVMLQENLYSIIAK